MAHYLITKSWEEPCDIRFWSFDNVEELQAVEEKLGGMHPDFEPIISFEVRDGDVLEAQPAKELLALIGIEIHSDG